MDFLTNNLKPCKHTIYKIVLTLTGYVYHLSKAFFKNSFIKLSGN